jgi:hypothetical protein
MGPCLRAVIFSCTLDDVLRADPIAGHDDAAHGLLGPLTRALTRKASLPIFTSATWRTKIGTPFRADDDLLEIGHV